MKMIVYKWSIQAREWKYHSEREVAVKVTPKRITITASIYVGKRFDREGRCLGRDGMFRYRLAVPSN